MQENITKVRPSWGRRLAGIEGLRGIAAISVLLYHLGLGASYQVLIGPVSILLTLLDQGLTLFFVLSGFLLFRPFVTTLMEDKALPSIRRYARNRLLRIYPAYVVIFVVTGLIFAAAFIKGSTHGLGPDNIGRITDPVQILANLALVQMLIPSFVMTGLPVSWSLTAEVSFYIILALIALWSARLIRRGASKTAVLCGFPVGMIALGVGVTLWGYKATLGLSPAAAGDFAFGQNWTAVLLRSVLGQADLFGYGMIAAVVVAKLHDREVHRVSTGSKIVLLLAAGLLELTGFTLLRPLLSNMSGVAAALILLAVVLPSSRHGNANRAAKVLEWLPFRFTGLISYSLYLWHLPILLWLISHDMLFGSNARSMPLNGLLVLAIALPLSTLTYYLVERPAMKLKKPTGRPAKGGPDVSCTVSGAEVASFERSGSLSSSVGMSGAKPGDSPEFLEGTR